MYDQTQQAFKVFAASSKALLMTVKELMDAQGVVNGLALQGNTLAYIKGRSLLVHDTQDKSGKPRVIKRDALLRTLAVNDKESLIAVGDDFGKIYIIHNTKQLIVQTLHWHAHRVSALRFIADSPYLLSGGEEAVIVQWHLETQSKTFISRLGAAITSIGLSSPSHSYYSVNLGDNSSKIVRFDNNKVKAHLNSVQFDQDGL